MREMRELFIENGISTDDFWADLLPMGHEIDGRYGGSDGDEVEVSVLPSCPFVLSVGTIEPRKGYDDLLDAFECLWGVGREETLVIVGKPGWKTIDLQSRIMRLLRDKSRLVWLQNASDNQLSLLYRNAIGLIAASRAEGYGLPILEAQAFGCPILARDIPVFREREQTGIDYFPRRVDASSFASHVSDWLDSPKLKRYSPVSPPSWSQSADRLVELVCGDKS
jgi:glycosyltransferase involved in cell wall biosynthesis